MDRPRTLAMLAAMVLLAASCARAGFEPGGGDAAGPMDLRVDAGNPPADAAAAADGGDADGSASLPPFGTPQPVAVLNTADDEDDPALTGDMLEIYFERSSDIWRATRASLTSPWSLPAKVTALSSSSADTTPAISADGLTIYIASQRSHPSAKGSSDIFVASRSSRSATWSVPVPVPELNTGAFEIAGGVTPDGLTIVFGSGPDTSTVDLFLATRSQPSDPWLAPVKLGAVNSPGEESRPWIDHTATLLYFASARSGGKGKRDIYVAERASSGAAFSSPVAVDAVNTSSQDEDPWLSADLRTMYFASEHNSKGKRDIFVVQR